MSAAPIAEMEDLPKTSSPPARNHRPFKKRCYLLCILLTGALVIALVTFTVLHLMKRSRICTTKECSDSAEHMVSLMDALADPCLDFHRFACGGLLRRGGLEPDLIPYKKSLAILKDVLEKEIGKEDDEVLIKMKNVYSSCLKQSVREDESLDNVLGLMARGGVGSWPSLGREGWIDDDLVLAERLPRLYFYGVAPLLDFRVNTEHRVIDMIPGQLFGRLYQLYTNQSLPEAGEFISAYQFFLSHTYQKLNLPRIGRTARRLIEFEANIAQMMEDNLNEDVEVKEATPRQLENMYPGIKWTSIFANLFYNQKDLNVDPEHIKVRVYNDKYFQALMMFIGNSDARTLAEYLSWRFFVHMMPYLGNEWRDLHDSYVSRVRDFIPVSSPSDLHLWEFCASNVGSWFPELVSNLILNLTVKADKISQLREYFDTYKNTLPKVITFQNWLDQRTKNQLLKMVEKFDLVVGRPPEFKDERAIQKKYDNLDVEQGDLFITLVLEVWQNLVTSHLRLISTRTTSFSEWFKDPLQPKVRLFPGNQIGMSIGLLNLPFLDVDRPNYLNMAGAMSKLARLLAYEIYAAVGTAGNSRGLKAYIDYDNCTVVQYRELVGRDRGIKDIRDPEDTDLIISNFALHYGFKAYEEYVSHNGPDQNLPNLNFTPEQLYFISYAQTMCEPPYPEERLAWNYHSSKRYSIHSAIINSKSFGPTFKCQKGTPMNPLSKCQLWDMLLM